MGVPPAPKPKDSPEDLLKIKPDLTMTAKEFAEEFKKDQNAFLDKTHDKVIDLFGTVAMYDYSGGSDRGYLYLNPGLVNLGCFDPHPMSKAMPGQTVTLRGKWRPLIGFDNWIIAKVEGEPPPTISAEELAKQWKTDEAATAKKFRGKYLIVTGKILKAEKDVGTEIYLTGPENGVEVTCFFGTLPQDVAERHGWLKKGQRVRVLGEWLSGGPKLSVCVVLPPLE